MNTVSISVKEWLELTIFGKNQALTYIFIWYILNGFDIQIKTSIGLKVYAMVINTPKKGRRFYSEENIQMRADGLIPRDNMITMKTT